MKEDQVMSDSQLELIRQYIDTSGMRLSGWEKDILLL